MYQQQMHEAILHKERRLNHGCQWWCHGRAREALTHHSTNNSMKQSSHQTTTDSTNSLNFPNNTAAQQTSNIWQAVHACTNAQQPIAAVYFLLQGIKPNFTEYLGMLPDEWDRNLFYHGTMQHMVNKQGMILDELAAILCASTAWLMVGSDITMDGNSNSIYHWVI